MPTVTQLNAMNEAMDKVRANFAGYEINAVEDLATAAAVETPIYEHNFTFLVSGHKPLPHSNRSHYMRWVVDCSTGLHPKIIRSGGATGSPITDEVLKEIADNFVAKYA